MAENNPFVRTRKYDLVFANNRAAAQRGKAYRSRFARTCQAVATGFTFQANSTTARRCFPEKKRRPGRRVRLHAVMHFQNLDIEIRERFCGSCDERGEQCYTHTHITGFHDNASA